MTPDARTPHLRSILRHRRQLIADGATDRELAALVRGGNLRRAHRGWYLLAADWSVLSPEQQHLVRALAVDANAQSPPTFSYATAAILHGLPLLGSTERRVHVTVARPVRRRSSAGVFRHDAELPVDDVTACSGLRCTTLARTALDIARTETVESGLVCADAALRRLHPAGSRASDEVRAALLARLAAGPPSPGRARARRVVELADPAAESPLESLRRLQLLRLGFEVRSQVPVPSPEGGSYRMDFELVGREAFVEVDGRVKYTDERLRDGRSPERVVLEEKAREDWVRGVTGKRVVRWGWREAQSRERLARRLAAFGLPPPGIGVRRAHSDGPRSFPAGHR